MRNFAKPSEKKVPPWFSSDFVLIYWSIWYFNIPHGNLKIKAFGPLNFGLLKLLHLRPKMTFKHSPLGGYPVIKCPFPHSLHVLNIVHGTENNHLRVSQPVRRRRGQREFKNEFTYDITYNSTTVIAISKLNIWYRITLEKEWIRRRD